MRPSRLIFLTGIAVLQAASASAAEVEGTGLRANADNVPWARWQGRLSMGTAAPTWHAGLGGHETSGLKATGASLMGDYYFARSTNGEGRAGGLRATSGVVVGLRSQLWASQPGAGAGKAFSIERRSTGNAALPSGSEPAAETAALPYLGIGYTGLSNRGGWNVSADLGMLAVKQDTAVRLGRTGGGTPSLDELVRDLRLAPVLQLGISYAF